ncbi:MAG: alpha-L-fucosidase [Muribaculaceae bacterium]|nr:alpha-L-fucosidase [Muribaculaceae bacterium]
MKNLLTFFTLSIISLCSTFAQTYAPSHENLKTRQQFDSDRFGIFIHWGIYSMFGQGEWYLNSGILADEYAKAASAFYPIEFDASEWTSAIKDSGAKYICFTTRHHDGFSMFGTKQSDYNIVDATPFGRDILRELSDACEADSLHLHLYYSHLDWTRPDYPMARTGRQTGRDTTAIDWPHYLEFMESQLTELLTNYGDIRAIWFDGWWDHDEDSVPFNWELDRQYKLIHSINPACLVGNNHHQVPFEGEDIQIFERDVPGENSAGYAPDGISHLPLETCQTMNGMWGYKVSDTNYKTTPELIRYLVKTAGKGANLLLNIGPQPNGKLPDAALDRLRGIGQWLRENGETIYGTTGSPFPEMPWGTATTKDNRIFLHVMNPSQQEIRLPNPGNISSVVDFTNRSPLPHQIDDRELIITLPSLDIPIDYIIEIEQ